jgi:hypothetical protein
MVVTERWEPTQEEIRLWCLKIQAGWSQREEIVRRGGNPNPGRWALPRSEQVICGPNRPRGGWGEG